MSEYRPKARSTKLLVQQLDDEILVYDLERNQAHSLNGSAARVWTLCDGNRSVSEIAAILAPDVPAEEATRLVWHALDQFEQQHLLEGSLPEEKAPGMLRREMLLRLGLTAAMIPVVESIVSPPAVYAQSGGTGSSGSTAVS